MSLLKAASLLRPATGRGMPASVTSARARAMVLAAGLGTRLRPLSDERAKPLVPLGDGSVLGHIASRLAAAGFRDAVVNTHHRPEDFSFGFGDLETTFTVIHEPNILGTAGGVHGALPFFAPGPVVVWNGDILADPPLSQLVGRAGSGGMVFAVVARPEGEGTVGLGADGDIVRLRSERFGTEVSGGDYAGIAALGERILTTLPVEGCLVGDVALPELRRGGRIETVALPGGFQDIGSIAAYHAACLGWLAVRSGLGASWVHPTAQVDPGVVLRRCVVGAGAVLTGTGIVERAVLWPGARAAAPLSDVIVTTAGCVVPVQ